MGILDNDEKIKNIKEVPKKPQIVTDDEISNWFESVIPKDQKRVCMVLGEDGTGKSGLVLDHLHKQLKGTEDKLLVFDLDRGVQPLLKFHKEVLKNIIIIDPIEKSIKINDEGETYVDYVRVMEIIKRIIFKLINEENKNIKYVMFDGLSKFLEVCENQMRVDLNKNVSDGIHQLFWKKRKDYFFKVMDLLKMLKIDIYLIGHTNFILEQNQSAIPTGLNAMVYQRIICKDVRVNNEIKLIANINKSKYNPLKENKEELFMITKEGKVKFNSDKIFEGL